MSPLWILALASVLSLAASLQAADQIANKQPPDASESVRKAATLAESGHCAAALPILERSVHQVADRDLKRKVGLDGVRCAMTLGRTEDALRLVETLARDFPDDPAVLYAEVHAFSDLSSMASERLAKAAPSSPEAHELLAESYEMQGKWDDAEKQYRLIAAENPKLPGIHFRLGRLLLSRPNPPGNVAEDAKHEFEQELAIDPSNAGAEYVLGELARQTQNWDDAIAHFSRATKLDPQFSEAFLGLGVAWISLKRYSDAVTALETAVQLDPRNPDAHYQLGTAYTRSGRKQEAEKEFAIHQRLIGDQGGAAGPPSAPADEKK
jgi:tetratricopeptide (TPR) repeat protein